MKLSILCALCIAALISCSSKKTSNDESANADTVATSKPSAETDDLKKRATEDSTAYASLNSYDGEYEIRTESEGVDAKLQLTYKNDRTFQYLWSFVVDAEETKCKGESKGIVTMDRTQHGFDSQADCFVHFNFNGLQGGRYAVEISFEDQAKCKTVDGPCTFSGTYLKK